MDKRIEQEIIDRIADKVMEKMKTNSAEITLAKAKILLERLEQKSVELGMTSVLAVCGADGNIIAVHRMEGAYLASFDVAMKKAYTAVAVQMSTKRLGELAMPGGMFYGVDKADQGRLIIFGGGVPLYYNGKLIGGLGVSGGTSEEDHRLAEFGQEIFEKEIVTNHA